MNGTKADEYVALMKLAFASPQRWLSKREIESRALAALRDLPAFDDLTAIDVERLDKSLLGTWHVARIWRGHVVELPRGPAWDRDAKDAIQALLRCYRLDPRSRASRD
jgi:hypothetical protein